MKLSIDNGTFKGYIKSTMNDTFSVPITELKQNTADVVSQVVNNGMSAIIMQRSQPKAVISDYMYFMALEEAVTDLLDAKEAEKAKSEPTISLKAYAKKRWGKNL